MLNGKHYRMIARCIKDNSNTMYSNSNKDIKIHSTIVYKDTLVNDLCIEFKCDNHLFNRDTFINACNDD